MSIMLGDWDIGDVKGCNLPQKVQSAFTSVTSEILGADYEPIAYLGKQLTNGTNYRVLALKKPIVQNGTPTVVKMIIHEEMDGTARLVSISRVSI